MRREICPILLLLIVISIAGPAVYGQGAIRSGPDPATIRDPDLEKDSLHNLEVARNYFKLKKAYVATLRRCEEIIAGNPNFARIQEVLYMAGKSSLFLADNKGKQKPELYKRSITAEELRDMGRDYLTKLVQDYPDSQFSKEAQEDLAALGPTRTKP
jgi:hypothetical protein